MTGAHKLFLLCLFVLFGAFLTRGYAQTTAPQLPPPLENTAQSARASGMGSAFTAVEGDLTGLYLNPAGLASLRSLEISLLYQDLTGGMSQETLTTAFPLSSIAVLALGLDDLSFGNLQGLDVNGNPFANPFRSSLSLGLGLNLDPSLSLGFSTRYSYQYLSAGSDNISPSTSAGVLWSASENWRFGAFYSSNDSLSPAGTGIFKLGASWAQPLSRVTLDLALPSNGFNQIQLGAEEYLTKNIAVRAGYQQDLVNDPLNGFHGLTGGLGLNFSPFNLDYSFSPMGQLGLYQAVGLTYAFPEKINTPTPQPTATPTLTLTSTPQSLSTPALTPTPAKEITLSPTSTATTVSTPLISVTQSPSPTADPTPLPPVLFKPAPEGSDSDNLVVKKLQFKLPDTALASATPSPELTQAISDLSDKVNQNPKDAGAWIDLGNLYWKNGQADFAAQCFEEALTIWPENQTLLAWLREYKAKNHPME